jgi:hypothetical protein
MLNSIQLAELSSGTRKTFRTLGRNLNSNRYFYIIYLLLKFRLGDLFRFLDTRYDLMIEGYPRCANTYTWYSFLISQQSKIVHTETLTIVPYSTGIRLNGHTHQVSVIIHAVLKKKPVCLLIRKPDDAIVSWELAYGEDFEEVQGDSFSLEERIDYYIHFHEKLKPYKHLMYIAEFDRVTQNFKGIVKDLNSTYALDLCLDFNEDEIKEKVTQEIHHFNTTSSGQVNFNALHIPSATRKSRKPQLINQLSSSTYFLKMKRAWNLYQEFLR